MPTPFASGVRAWRTNKVALHHAAVVDFSEQTLAYDKEIYYIRFETKKRLIIYHKSESQKHLLNMDEWVALFRRDRILAPGQMRITNWFKEEKEAMA